MNAVVETELDVGISVVTSEIMRALQTELPLNDFGLPLGIYRPDFLPLHLYVAPGQQLLESPSAVLDQPESKTVIEPDSAPTTTIELPEIQADPFSLLAGQGDGLPDAPLPALRQDVEPEAEKSIFAEYRIAGFPSAQIQHAFVPLQYDEGFPAFENGQPFWQKLHYEPGDAYGMFERYLLMSQGIAPVYDESTDAVTEGRSATGTRTIEGLVAQMNIGGQLPDAELLQMVDTLRHYSYLYYWGLRARGYDLFRVTQFQQQQEVRAIETHNDHYIQSRQLRARLTDYMNNEEEFWDLMTPKTAIDMHKHLTQLERISVGLPGSGPHTGKAGEGIAGGQSTEFVFRTIAQTHAGDGDGGSIIDDEGNILDSALEDVESTKILQELIIRTSTQGHGR